MPEVRILSSTGRVKKRFNSAIDPADAVGAGELLEYWAHKIGLGTGARIEVYDKRCKCRRKFEARNR